MGDGMMEKHGIQLTALRSMTMLSRHFRNNGDVARHTPRRTARVPLLVPAFRHVLCKHRYPVFRALLCGIQVYDVF